MIEPDSEEIRRILEPFVMFLARNRDWTMKGGEMADVARRYNVSPPGCEIRHDEDAVKYLLYIFTCSSHFGPLTKSSVAKYPAVII